jgi:hypothetical protein
MKKLVSFICLLTFFIGFNALANSIEANEWGNAANNIQIGISMKANNAQIKTNQSFSVSVRIKNLSTNDFFYFYLPLASTENDPISFIVTSPSGKDKSPIPPLVEHGSGANVNVPPNQIYSFEFNLGYLCKFDEVGTYKIIAKMNVSPTQDKNRWAISNPLSVTVVPGF